MRMSIWALTLADIVTLDGKQITATAWRLRGGNNLRRDLSWPRQVPSFSEKQIKFWQTSLRSAFLRPNPDSDACQFLRETRILHHWNNPSLANNWIYRYSPVGNVIYFFNQDKWDAYQPQQLQSTRNKLYHKTGNPHDTLPSTADSTVSVYH